MPSYEYAAQSFFQFQPGPRLATESGPLVTFAASAREIRRWAGVPRKAWALRALYQRVLNETRIKDIAAFFEPAPAPAEVNLSPTSITVALVDPGAQLPTPQNGFKIKFVVADPPDATNLLAEMARLAAVVRPPHVARLTGETRAIVDGVIAGAIAIDAAERQIKSDDYLALFVLDLIGLAQDPGAFLDRRGVVEADLKRRLLDALFELTKPALIVDGQHRVFGASEVTGAEVQFLVCASPQCSWKEQAFQFVVINEEARPVDATILYDIFGSSLTRPEATDVRARLGRIGRSIEVKIAAVVAARDGDSPFYNLVRLNVEGIPAGTNPYLSPRVIVDLIEGGRGSRGFRDDRDLMRAVVEPSLASGEALEAWTDWQRGRWRSYWYALWRAVREHFNGEGHDLWRATEQTNLTKGVALRALQDLIVEELIKAARDLEKQIAKMRNVGVEEDKIAALRRQSLLPNSPQEFEQKIRSDFLRGFPQAFFEKDWVTSLDTAEGYDTLRLVLFETWSSYVSAGGNRRYPYWKNKQIFETKKPTGVSEPAPDEGD
jgi:hypothetical protein